MCRSHTRCASFTPPSRASRRWDASRDGRDDLSARARLRKNSAAAAALSSFLPPSSFLLASAWLARTRSLLIFSYRSLPSWPLSGLAHPVVFSLRRTTTLAGAIAAAPAVRLADARLQHPFSRSPHLLQRCYRPPALPQQPPRPHLRPLWTHPPPLRLFLHLSQPLWHHYPPFPRTRRRSGTPSFPHPHSL